MKQGDPKRFLKTRGVLSLLVMLSLAFFSIVLGVQVLLHASVGLSSRALDQARRNLHVERTVKNALGEWLTRCLEADSVALSQQAADGVGALLSQLGVEASLVETPSARMLPLAYPFSLRTTLETPSSLLWAEASPELRRLLSGTLERHSLGNYGFVCGGGAGTPRQLRFEALALGVPMPRHPLYAYSMPGDIGDRDERFPDVRFEETGLATQENESTGGEQSPGLGYGFRWRASEACAYRLLFSQQTLEKALLFAGKEHVLDLSEAPETAPRWDGFRRETSRDVFDLSQAGGATRAGLSRVGPVFLLHSPQAQRTLRLEDSGLGGSLAPLVLFALGSTKEPLVVELGNIGRPFVLIASSVLLRPDPDARVAGVLLLAPDVTLPALSRPCHVVSLAMYRRSSLIDTRSVQADLERSPALAEVLPRARLLKLRRLP